METLGLPTNPNQRRTITITLYNYYRQKVTFQQETHLLKILNINTLNNIPRYNVVVLTSFYD